jgi:hypothetical protein
LLCRLTPGSRPSHQQLLLICSQSELLLDLLLANGELLLCSSSLSRPSAFHRVGSLAKLCVSGAHSCKLLVEALLLCNSLSVEALLLCNSLSFAVRSLRRYS